ncbi:acetylserotonin O-methyltransferase-like isoform X6 [Mastomys coucha]|uniref:acetylserotonin O-methyltransferase-like isoform X6 n=1 Tax=Mastomys coucha TaxID=35658 RepID=UPI001261EA87|nr:acetylserotonin O-methyltransferase-like isoform X6 [Mastomys coucha]
MASAEPGPGRGGRGVAARARATRARDRAFRVLMDHAHGFMASQVLFAACELGVFDVLAARGGAGAEAVAGAANSDPRATRLLMDACAGLGLLRAGPDGSFSNTALASDFLVTGSPLSQRGMLLYLAGTTYRCWAHLADGVREGRNQYARAVGVAAVEDPFAAIYRSDAERRLFACALRETWSVWGGRVLTAFDLSAFQRICDLGGGTGALARQAARLYPGSRVTVFDVPDVVAAARVEEEEEAEPGAGPGPRVRFVGGDFFRSRLPRADLFILARVLHDWTDGACVRLLRRAGGACGAGGAVLVVEAALAGGGAERGRALLLSLNMLLQTRGRERSGAEYRALAARAGFPRLRLRRPGGPYAAMLARK